MSSTVQVWCTSSAGPRDWLNPVELERFSRYRSPAAAQDFLVGTTLARFALGRWLGVPAGEVALDRSCERCAAQHGRPRVPGVHVSIAHASAMALVAVGDDPVGVDLEPMGREIPTDCGADELVDWVHKEAVLKLTGDGLRIPMQQVRISRGAVVSWPTQPPPQVRIHDLTIPGFLAAVATTTGADVTTVTPTTPW